MSVLEAFDAMVVAFSPYIPAALVVGTILGIAAIAWEMRRS